MKPLRLQMHVRLQQEELTLSPCPLRASLHVHRSVQRSERWPTCRALRNINRAEQEHRCVTDNVKTQRSHHFRSKHPPLAAHLPILVFPVQCFKYMYKAGSKCKESLLFPSVKMIYSQLQHKTIKLSHQEKNTYSMERQNNQSDLYVEIHNKQEGLWHLWLLLFILEISFGSNIPNYVANAHTK